LRLLGKRRLDRIQGARRVAAGGTNQIRGEAFAIVEQNFENVFGGEPLMPAALSQALGSLNETARPLGVFIDIHILPSTLGAQSSQHADSDALKSVDPGLDMGRVRVDTRVEGLPSPGITLVDNRILDFGRILGRIVRFLARSRDLAAAVR